MVSFTICLKICAFAVAVANISVAIDIFVHGIFLVLEYLNKKKNTIGFTILYFEMTLILIYIGMLLLIGTIKANQKYISLYLLLSCLTWFVLTILLGTHLVTNVEITEVEGTEEQREYTNFLRQITYPSGLVALWCGQLGVYAFYKDVVERNRINAGESYVSAAVHS